MQWVIVRGVHTPGTLSHGGLYKHCDSDLHLLLPAPQEGVGQAQCWRDKLHDDQDNTLQGSQVFSVQIVPRRDRPEQWEGEPRPDQPVDSFQSVVTRPVFRTSLAPSWLTETPPTSCLSSTTWGTASWSWTRRWARRECWRRPSSTTSPTSSSYSRRGYITGITAASRMGSMFTGEDLWPVIKTRYYDNLPTIQGAAVPRGWADPNGVHHERWMEVWTGKHRYCEDYIKDCGLKLMGGSDQPLLFVIS